VRAMYPSLRDAEHARFRVRARLTPAQEQATSKTLLRLVPTCQGEDGRSLFALPEHAVPQPPARSLELVGGGMGNGFEFLGHFVERCGLARDARVLDVGCGVGRMALPLGCWLRPPGRYAGFDIVRSGIEWARAHIGVEFAHTAFAHVDIHNRMYNPTGTLAADRFAFPYPDRSFDFAFLTSVFTHMVGREVRHYLDELARVLVPGARCLCTWFLRDAEADSLLAAGRARHRPVHPIEDGFTTNPALPEEVIAFRRDPVRAWIQERGFDVEADLPGAWCGRERFTSYQDLLLLRRRG